MKRSLIPLLAMILWGCGNATHPDPGLPGVRIAIGGRAALDYIPVYLAHSLGYFREEGVDVSLQDLPGSAKAIQALLGGSADVVVGGYDAAVQITMEGKPVHSIAVLERWPPLVVVVSHRSSRHLRSIRDLKGAVVGVSAPGSSTHRFINYLLVKNGISPSDVSTVGVGVNFSLAAALQQGQVDAAVTGPLGMALVAKDANVMALGDCRTAEGARRTLGNSNFPSAVLMARPKLTREHPDSIRRVVKATLRALAWIGNHSAREIVDAMPSEYKGQDSAVYLRAVTEILPAFSPDGVMPADGPANVKAFLAVSDERVRNAAIDLTTTYTNEFVSSK